MKNRISITGILGVIFITLKLLGYIDWSWWWVTAPLWIPLTILIVFLIMLSVTNRVLDYIERTQ